jgi:formylglycine-generating enzyme required for sulfatase activity
MPEAANVGTAKGHGHVHAAGDIVGRDKIVNLAQDADDRSMTTYIEAAVRCWERVPKPVLAAGGRKTPLIADVYVDATTDALRAGEPGSLAPPRFSAIEAQLAMPRLALCGVRNSGKSSAMRAFALLAARRESPPPRLVPVILDADDTFGSWVCQTTATTASALAKFVQDEWAFDIADLRTTDRIPVFLWDHTYLLPAEDRLKVLALLASLERWVPQARHVVSARSVAIEGFGLPPDFQVVGILSLGASEVLPYLHRYREAGVDLATVTVIDGMGNRGDLVGSGHSPTLDDFTAEYRGRLVVRGLDPHRSDAVAGRLPGTFWQLLRNRPSPISFFGLLELLTGGRRSEIEEATALIDALVDDRVLGRTEDGMLVVADQHTARDAALSALSDEGILRRTVESVHDSPLMLELVSRWNSERKPGGFRRVALSMLNKADAAGEQPSDLRAVTRLRLALAALESDYEEDDRLLEHIRELADYLSGALGPQWPLPMADEFRRLISRAHAALAMPVTMTFRLVDERHSRVSLPSRCGQGRDELTVAIEYPVWFAVEPLTNAQLGAILRRRPVAGRAMFDHVRAVRPEAWGVGQAIESSVESAFDPAVGIDLDDAYGIASDLTVAVGEQFSGVLEARVPTVAEWGLLDTGLAEGADANLPRRRGSFSRPIATGISGSTRAGFGDVYGNAMEWTSTSWGSDVLDEPGHADPYEPNGHWDLRAAHGLRLLRGGSWLFDEGGPRCACLLPQDARFPDVGFRPCIRPYDLGLARTALPSSFQILL